MLYNLDILNNILIFWPMCLAPDARYFLNFVLCGAQFVIALLLSTENKGK